MTFDLTFFCCRNCWKYRICLWTSYWRYHYLLWGRYQVSKGPAVYVTSHFYKSKTRPSRHSRYREMGARMCQLAQFPRLNEARKQQAAPIHHVSTSCCRKTWGLVCLFRGRFSVFLGSTQCLSAEKGSGLETPLFSMNFIHIFSLPAFSDLSWSLLIFNLKMRINVESE